MRITNQVRSSLFVPRRLVALLGVFALLGGSALAEAWLVRPERALAAACTSAAGASFEDGDGNDSDASVNGTYVVASTATWENSGGPNDAMTCGSLNVVVPSGVTLTIDQSLTTTGTITVQDGGTLVLDTDAGTNSTVNTVLTAGTVNVNDGGTISMRGNVTTGGDAGDGTVTNIVAGDMTIAADSGSGGGLVSADGQGCPWQTVSSGDGFGPDSSNVCTILTAGFGEGDGDGGGVGGGSGAGYGGAGGDGSHGAVGGATYGNAANPLLFGSSGGNGFYVPHSGVGGGVVKITVTGTLTNEGSISANGGDGLYTFETAGYHYYGSGGGSGGSINVNAGTIDCSAGSFSASGGDGGAESIGTSYYGGGGGGGRVYLTYQTDATSGGCSLSSLSAADVAPGGIETVPDLDPENAPNWSNNHGADGTYLAILQSEDSYLSAKDTLSNGPLMAGDEDVIHEIQFIIGNALYEGTTITVTFPAEFTVTGAPTDGASSGLGGTPSFGFTSSTMTATCGTGGCPAGTIVIGGGTANNPLVADTYFLTVSNDQNGDTATVAVIIIDSDKIAISASVDEILTFDLDTPLAETCSETAAPYSVDLGALPISAVAVSGSTDGIRIICLDLATNAAGGLQVQVTSANGALASSSAPADTIGNLGVPMSAGTENYGFCAASLASGLAAESAASGSLPASICSLNSETNEVGFLNTVTADLTSSGPLLLGSTIISVQGAASSSTEAHADYSDTVTFVVTGTF